MADPRPQDRTDATPSGELAPTVRPRSYSGTEVPAAEAPPALVGQVVGEYRIAEVIGEGGMGTVFLGVHPLIDKKVAVKVLKPALSHDPELMRRFLAEARAANQIGHPNIVDVFAFGALPDGSQYFVMELLQGRSLATRLDGGQVLGYAEGRDVFGQVLDGLEAAHGQGIVHRDLKPDNIYLCDRPGGGITAKLLDFGVAKFIGDGPGASKTQTGMPIGTPLYMSPEHCRGKDVGPRSDLYSLGCILYESFTGRVPLDAPSPSEVISAQLTLIPARPSTLADLPEDLERLILRCLDKDQGARPATVDALRRELLPILERLSPQGAPQVLTAPTAPRAAFAPTLQSMPPRRRRLALSAVVFAVAAAAGVAAAVRLWPAPSEPPAPPPMATPSVPVPAKVEVPTPTPTPTPRPSTGRIRVAIPEQVGSRTLRVNGNPQAAEEFEAPLGAPLKLELEAAGFEPLAMMVTPSGGTTVVNLAPTKLEPRPRAVPSVQKSPGAAPPPPPPRVKRVEDL